MKIKARPAEFRVMMKNDGCPWFCLSDFGGRMILDSGYLILVVCCLWLVDNISQFG